MEDFPLPAYPLIGRYEYLVLPVQWSSGCPDSCEFCDIPENYGRVPRDKSAPRRIAELSLLAKQEGLGAVFFVDDNLVGNRNALRAVLPSIVDWQKENGRKLRFIGERALNVTADARLLGQLRDAGFTDFYFGLESPDPQARIAIDKKHNQQLPIGTAIQTIQFDRLRRRRPSLRGRATERVRPDDDFRFSRKQENEVRKETAASFRMRAECFRRWRSRCG